MLHTAKDLTSEVYILLRGEAGGGVAVACVERFPTGLILDLHRLGISMVSDDWRWTYCAESYEGLRK